MLSQVRRVRPLPVGGKHRTVKLSAKPFDVGAHSTTTVKLRLPAPLRSQLLARRKLSISLTLSFPVPGEADHVIKATVVPKLAGKKKKAL